MLDYSVVHNHIFPLQVSAVESLEGPLLQVEGLSDLRLELHSKKMNLHLVLIDELHRHLYIKSTSRVVQRNKEKGRMRLVKEALCYSLLWQCRILRNIICFPECCTLFCFFLRYCTCNYMIFF